MFFVFIFLLFLYNIVWAVEDYIKCELTDGLSPRHGGSIGLNPKKF